MTRPPPFFFAKTPPSKLATTSFLASLQVVDDKDLRRRFRASNYQSTTRVKPFICTMPMRLDEGWNQIQFNLSDFTRRAYGTNYIETCRVQVCVCVQTCLGMGLGGSQTQPPVRLMCSVDVHRRFTNFVAVDSSVSI